MNWSLNRFRLSTLCCVWLLALATTARAQYRFDHWTTDNGLPQNGIRRIAQTPDGYLWFTTLDGLVRFDGARFTVFTKGNTPGISSKTFTILFVDKDGSLWAGTEENHLMIYREGVFNSYIIPGPPANDGIIQIDANRGGEPRIRTRLGSYYFREGKFLRVPPEDNPDDIAFYRGPSGAEYTIQRHGVRQAKDGRVNDYPFTLDKKDYIHHENRYLEDRSGNFWIGARMGLLRLKDGNIKLFSTEEGIPPGAHLRPMLEDTDGSLWLAVRPRDNTGVGLARFKDDRFTYWAGEAGLTDGWVYDVLKDREGNIWVATNRGLNRLKKTVLTAYSTESGLPYAEVSPLLQTANGDILVSSLLAEKGVLCRFKDGRFTPYPAGNTLVAFSLWEARNGRLWIGGNHRMYWYENGTLRNMTYLIGDSATIWAIHEDANGNIWLGTNQGLYKLKDDCVLARYTIKEGMPGDDVKVIHEARDGKLWFGTSSGLAKLENGKFSVFTATDGLAGNRIRSLYEDSEGTLWIGTLDDGLSRFRNGHFFSFKEKDGLFNNGVFQILEDNQGRFWIGCVKGIYCVSQRQLNDFADGRIEALTSVAYGKADGMLNSECKGVRQPAGFKTPDGKLWFPTMDGIVIINPAAVEERRLPPPVRIEAVSLDRSMIEFSSDVILKPGQDDLEISYTALSFTKPEQIKFKYRLDGRDDEWTNAGTRRVAYYPYLPPGSYTFRVIAANSDGIWNREGASIRIVVLAPFYQRWWFLIACSFATAGAALLLFRARVAQLQKKQAAQEEFSRQLIASQEQERQRIAVELHDGLGQSLVIIRNRALLSLTNPDDHERAITQIGEISEAANSALLEIRQLASSLHPYQLDRLGLASALEEMIARLRDSSDIKFTCEIDELDGALSKEAQINLYRIVQESLNNVIKHSAATASTVQLKKAANRLCLTIQDNGKGFEVAQLANKNQGLGLTGMAERAKVLRTKPELYSAPGQGTTIYLDIQLEYLADER